MNIQVTLNLDENTVFAVRELAQHKGVSMDRLAEVLFEKAAASRYQNIEDLPIADWILQLDNGEPVYETMSRKEMKEQYFESKR